MHELLGKAWGRFMELNAEYFPFGPYRLYPGQQLLLRGDDPVALAPKVFDLLVCLVRTRGHLVTRDELMKCIWPDSFVEETNLTVNISLLRKVLGDAPDGRPYIETVPRRGYRFHPKVLETVPVIAPGETELRLATAPIAGTTETARGIEEARAMGEAHVTERIGPSAGETTLAYAELQIESVSFPASLPNSLEPVAAGGGARGGAHSIGLFPSRFSATYPHVHRAGQPLGRRAALLLALLTLIIVGTAVYFHAWHPSGAQHAASGPRSLAILPFTNLRRDPDSDFLGFSLADAVITKLVVVSELTVRPSSSVARYAGKPIDLRQISSDLNVDTLLTGGYIRDGDDLRITTQLVQASTRKILWRDTIDLKYDKLLDVQDRVTEQIIAGLELRPTAAEAEHLRPVGPIDAQAYEYYLRGVDFYAANDFSTAVKMLEASVKADPRYPLAWAALGRAYTTNASLQFGGMEHYQKAEAAYQKALALDPSQISPRVYMGNLFTDTGRVEKAVPLLKEALAVNPNYAEAHWELGYAYRFGGLLKEATAEAERARQLDPAVKLNSSAINSYLYLGQYQRFLEGLPFNQAPAYIVFYRGFAAYHLGKKSLAKEEFDRAYRLDPSLLPVQVGRALSLGMEDRRVQGLALLHETEARIGDRGVSDPEGIYKVVQAYAVLGDKVSALRLLRRSIEGGFFCYPYFLTDPLLNSIRGEPEFKSLMDQARRRHEDFKRNFAFRG